MKRARLWILAVILLIGGGWAFVHREDLVARAKAWRAGQLADESLQDLAAGRRDAAALKAGSAMQLAPWYPPALKAAAQVLTATGDPRAAAMWADLADADPTPLHLALAAKNLAVVGDRERGAAYLARLEEQSGTELLVLQVKAAQALAYGDLKGSLDALTALESRGGLSASEAVALATLRRAARTASETERDADSARLREIAATDLPEALTAMALLAADLEVGDPEATTLAERLANHPRASIVHKLAAEKLASEGEADWTQRVRTMIGAEASLWSDEDRIAAATWLLAQGATQTVLDALPQDVAVGNRNLYILRMRALHLLGMWDALQTELQQGSLPLSEVERHAALASAASHVDGPDAVEGHWRRALAAAGTDPGELARLGARAMRAGWTTRAVEIYERLARDPRSMREAFGALVAIARQRGMTEVLPVLERAARELPNSDPVLSDLVAVRFLLGKGQTADLETAEGLVARNPRVFACRVALALGRLAIGDPTRAADAFEGVAGGDWRKVQPSMAAVYAAALGAAGDQTGARKVLDQIDLAALRPEEWEFVRRFVR